MSGNRSSRAVIRLVRRPQSEKSASNLGVDDKGPFSAPDGITTSITFVVEGDRVLHVSKEVLALMSPVFRRMFESDFRERDANTIPLPDKTYDDMVDFLSCLYPNILKPISDENVFSVLGLAEEYQVDLLREKCLTHLLNKCNGDEASHKELVLLLLTSELYTLPSLYEAAFERVSKVQQCCELNEIPEFFSLSSDTRNKLLYRKSLALEDLKISDENVHKVLQLASEFKQGDLIQKCEDHLVARCKKSEKPLVHGLVTILNAADKYNLPRLREESIELAIKRKSFDLEQSPVFANVSHEMKLKIYSKRLKMFEMLFGRLSKLRCHCCRKHSDYNCKICFIAVTKEVFANAGMLF
ncbi:hypothetical protein CHS0354_008521 [Potamilus streckersoni]|uniref:BTB domain-containing protein n=1 Tax=Potamilus streckersoni TaxID=2493646 RepID=A0AAE0S7U2_9BIVA|nr:hypothetical protein CHS0354_008521 [Potamilus streckersoni]